MPWSVWQVTEYEEGRSFTWALLLAPGMRATGGHQVTADGDGTTAEFRLESGGSLGRLLGPVLGRTVFSRNTRNATEGLKNYLERRGPPRDPESPTLLRRKFVDRRVVRR